jgi:hypothetical protein
VVAKLRNVMYVEGMLVKKIKIVILMVGNVKHLENKIYLKSNKKRKERLKKQRKKLRKKKEEEKKKRRK